MNEALAIIIGKQERNENKVILNPKKESSDYFLIFYSFSRKMIHTIKNVKHHKLIPTYKFSTYGNTHSDIRIWYRCNTCQQLIKTAIVQ